MKKKWQNIKNQKLLTKLDLEGLMQLMDSGFTFQQCLSLLETKENHQIFQYIQNKLLEGLQLKDFLIECIPKKYSNILQGFIRYTSFQNSLHLTLNIINSMEQRINKIKRKLLYPTILVLLTTIGLFFFDLVCIPVLNDLIMSFDMNSNQFKIIRVFIHVFIVLIVIVMILLLVFAIYIRKDEHKKDIYLFLEEHYNQSLFVKYYSQEFMRYYMECTKAGISTKNTINIMKQIPKKPIIYFLSCEIEVALLQGNDFLNSLKNTHLDADLMRFMQIAVYSNDKEKILTGYLTYSDTYVEKRLSVYTSILQALAYIIIGYFMIMIYQVLMVPLSLISTI